MTDTSGNNLIELAADIVSAYVGNNTVPASELPGLIAEVYGALQRTSAGIAPEPAPEPVKPAVPVKKSVTPDYIVCLEDGKKFKSLKRHLRTQYNISPEEYRENLLIVQVGRSYDQRDLLRRLVDMQYERNDMNLVRGKFRVRGEDRKSTRLNSSH